MKSRRMFWRVTEQIQSLIHSGMYPPGSRLPPERELAESFDVSRPTVREAIIALEVMDLVEVKTSSGVYVKEQNSKGDANEAESISAFELTQARALVEGEAAALAAKSIDEEELVALRATLDAMEKGINAEQADKEFHLIISNATRNKALVLAVKRFWELRDSQATIKNAYANVCGQSDQARLKEHKDIFHALEANDAQAARTAMHAHFNRLINALFEQSEAQALEEIRKKTSQTRDLYSLKHLVK